MSESEARIRLTNLELSGPVEFVGVVRESEKGQPDGIATLGTDGILSPGQRPPLPSPEQIGADPTGSAAAAETNAKTYTDESLANFSQVGGGVQGAIDQAEADAIAAASAYVDSHAIPLIQKGQPGGVASLDASGVLGLSQRPPLPTPQQIGAEPSGSVAALDQSLRAYIDQRIAELSTSSPADPMRDALFGSNSGLAAYWKLDEASGQRLDSVGGFHLNEGGNPVASSPGIQKDAAQFVEDANRFLTCPHDLNGNLSPGTRAFTIAFWLYLDSTQTSEWCTPLSKSASNYLEKEWVFDARIRDGTLILHQAQTGGSHINARKNGFALANNWTFVLGEFRVNSLTLFVNAFEVDDAVAGSSFQVGAAPVRMGSFHDSSKSIKGAVDELGMWHRVLTQEEKSWLFNSGQGRTYG